MADNALQDNASWARRFMGGVESSAPTTTNLAQRARYQNDIALGDQEDAKQKQQQERELLVRDKGARDLFYKEAQIGRQLERDRFQQDLKEREFQMNQELEPLKLQNLEASLAVKRAAATRALNTELRTAKQTQMLEEQTEALDQGVFDLLEEYGMGTPEFAAGVATLSSQLPFADPANKRQWFSQAKIKGDPEQVATILKNDKLGEFDKSASLSEDGQYTIMLRPKKQQVDSAAVLSRRDRLMRDRTDPNLQTNEGYMKYIDETMAKEKSEPGAPAAAAPEAEASPQTFLQTLQKDVADGRMSEAEARKLIEERGFKRKQ